MTARTVSNLLNNEQTADLLGIKPNTLEIWRHKGIGPRFCKLGSAKQSPIRYLRAEVESWLEQQSFASTSAYSPATQTSTKHGNLQSSGASA